MAGFRIPGKPVATMLKSETTSRQAITERCAQLVRERNDLDPAGFAYEAKTLQLDCALSALFMLGPDPEHPAEV